jgi:hypothetical protein
VSLVITDILEERIASIIRVTTLAVTSNHASKKYIPEDGILHCRRCKGPLVWKEQASQKADSILFALNGEADVCSCLQPIGDDNSANRYVSSQISAGAMCNLFVTCNLGVFADGSSKHNSEKKNRASNCETF